ncbi:MAG TPA: hypothetical protein VMT18_05290 [Planctomycetota bacterium]|nr:hypothetical protein [Planctomycetota bacterium]
MLLSLALTVLALSPSAQAPAAAPAAAPAPQTLAQRVAEARRLAAPAYSAQVELRERQRLAALYPQRPAAGLGSASRYVALGQTPLQVRADERLGSAGRRAALSRPTLPTRRSRR